jgi:c-di-GMP phosphodiesterase
MGAKRDFLTVIRPYERLTAAVIMTLALLCAGVMTVLSHFSKTEEQARNDKNQRASDYVASLYREAETVSRAAEPFEESACTNEVLTRLRHIVAVNPHIRSVNLYPENGTGCSSLEGRLPERKVSYSEGHVPFYTTMKQEDGYIYYLVYFRSSASLTGVAVNGYFVRDALRYISPDAAFYPLQDFMKLSPAGYAWKSSQYPFVLVSSDSMNIRRLLLHSRAVIIFILGVSLLAGWLTYVSTGLINTPRFALKYYLYKKSFYPVYQPVISTRDRKVAGLEILMRCGNKKGNEASPALFIPLAEQSGMIGELTLQLLEKVREDFAMLSEKGLYLAVNITSEIVENPETLSELLKFTEHAQRYGLDVLVEITERQSFSLTEQLSEKFALLRKAGLHVAIDDFGTGYSNLSSITQLNPDYLKIDKDFTGYSMAGGVREAVLESVLHISAITAIPVIAEGIETPAQFQYLRERGVWLFQGYLFSRPCDGRSVSNYIRDFYVQF